MKLQKIIDEEGVKLDSENLENINKHLKENHNKDYDNLIKDFMCEWKCNRGEYNPITKEEYYAVMEFVKYLKRLNA